MAMYTLKSLSTNFDPMPLAVVHFDVIFAELELFENLLFDHRAAERFACSWVLLSHLLGRVILQILLDVILLHDGLCIFPIGLRPGNRTIFEITLRSDL